MTGFFLRPLIKNKPSWSRKWLTSITRYGLITAHGNPPFWVSITQAARQGIDGKGIESRRATAPPPADETPPHLDMDSSGGTEREKGTAARRGPPAKRVRSWTEGSVGSASRDGTVVAKVVYEKYAGRLEGIFQCGWVGDHLKATQARPTS